MPLRMPALALAGALLFSSPACALDLRHATERLLDHLGQLGLRIDWEAVEVLDEEVRVSNVRIADGDHSWNAGAVYLRGFGEEADRYLIGTVRVPWLAARTEEYQAAVEMLGLSGLRVPRDPAPLPEGSLVDFDGMAFGSFSLSAAGRQLMLLEDAHLAVTAEGDEARYSGAIESFRLELDGSAPLVRDSAAAMGYRNVKGFLEYDWSLRGRPADVTVDHLMLSLVDAGTVSLSGELKAPPESGVASRGAHRAGVLLDIEGLELEQASLRFDDGGITGRLLDHIAALQGTDANVVRLQAQALAAMQAGSYLGLANVPQVLSALQAFLAEPASMQVTAAPESPVPLAGMAQEGSIALAERLSLKVVAND